MLQVKTTMTACVRRCQACAQVPQVQLQLMAPLIAMFEEAADWLAECSPAAAEACVGAPLSWDWLTVAVYTCACNDAASALSEATVRIANEGN